MEADSGLRFDNTEIAFSYKSDNQLRKAGFIFNVVNHPVIADLATTAIKWALKLKLPVKNVIRSTAFEHFCGGETIEECDGTIRQLARFSVKTILDYSVEGEKTEDGFEATTNEVLRTVEKAKNNPDVPFCVFKITGIADSDLLEKIQKGDILNQIEQQSYECARVRVDRICAKAFDYHVPVLIDAEDSWYQDAIDNLANEMMNKYNRHSPIVFNTFQMYRADMYDKLARAFDLATLNNFFLGVKMVRGAYMEIERKRAEENNYPDPIYPTKELTDEAFNKGLTFCVENIQRIALMCGSHNEYSNLFLTVLMEKNGIAKNDARIWFAQLLGMSDTISFNLAHAGYHVAKYVPYGPVEAVMPYLFRRAEENTSVEGQSSRELIVIRKELKRRKNQ